MLIKRTSLLREQISYSESIGVCARHGLPNSVYDWPGIATAMAQHAPKFLFSFLKSDLMGRKIPKSGQNEETDRMPTSRCVR
jgi:hypothetical protein